MFGALKLGFRSTASLILVRNVVGELQPKRTLAASRGFLAAARLSCFSEHSVVCVVVSCTVVVVAVAQLVARRTNNRKIVGSKTAKGRNPHKRTSWKLVGNPGCELVAN